MSGYRRPHPAHSWHWIFPLGWNTRKEQGMNRRLFWKIFLPFWVAQAVLLGALYIRLHYRLHSERPWWIQPERQVMPSLAKLAAQTYDEGQQPALRATLDQFSLKNRASYWLLDARGNELSGRPMTRHLLDHAVEASRSESEGVLRSYESNVLVASTATSSGRYTLVAELTPPPLSERVPGDIIWTLKLGTIFSAILCLIIAHYLSKPIERLRDATNELARGNLDIRVGSSIGSRRDEIADLVHDFDSMAGEL